MTPDQADLLLWLLIAIAATSLAALLACLYVEWRK